MASKTKMRLLLTSLIPLLLVGTCCVYAAPTGKPATKIPATANSRMVLYKFVDERGTLVIKDYLPPEVVPRGYTVVNQFGQTIEVVPPVLTKAELVEAKRIKAEQAAQERARKEAQKHDAELLRQFTTVEDIQRARDTQIAALDVQVNIRNGQNNLMLSQMEEMQKHAADYERRSQPVPPELLRNIGASQKQLAENADFIATQNRAKDDVAERFKRDIVRFKELHALHVLRGRDRDSDGGVIDANTSVFPCTGSQECQKAWQLAQIYARDNGTRSLEIVTDTLILTGKAVGDRDIALSFSKVPDKDDNSQIVLEVNCAKSEAGAALCASERAHNILTNFADYLAARLRQ